MEKILFIAYVFPPIAYAGTHRTLRLCKHLAQMGYSIDVLTIEIQKDLHNDFQLLKGIEKDVTIIRTPIRDPYRLHRTVKAKMGNSRIGKLLASLIGRSAEIISKPDHMVYWLFSALLPAVRLIKENRYKTIYTTSPPHSVQILGYLLKKMAPGVKWVADMRDPVLDNLMMDRTDMINRVIHRWLEKKIAMHADAVIFNTAYALECFKQRYRTSKAHLIRNSYDEANFESNASDYYEQFTLSHVGSIYSFRNVDPLFEALSQLYRKGAIDEKKFRLLFVGMNDATLMAKIEKFGLDHIVEIKGMVPHRQAIEIMQRSHLLLLVKGLGKNSGSQIPGKLYEYLASGNQIVHIGPTESEAAEIIESENAGCTFNDNVEALADYLHKNYSMVLENPKKLINLRPNRDKFSSRNMAIKMQAVLQSLEEENLKTLSNTSKVTL